MNKKVKKIYSLFIIISLISLCLFGTVYADETSLEGNTNSGGSETAGNDPAYAHKFMAYPENQGYRVSIVDKSGYRVTNSVDIVNYVPNDLLTGKGIQYK